ncbi:MAG: hypothetical protein M1524_03215 [Patescibacteria group bacterium]|nr:hypothetical protein [Patescibacteria group bacterium]
MKRNGIIILATVLLFQVFFLIKLYAQKTPTGLSVTPSNFEFTIIPGEQVIKTITLDNLTSKPVDIQVLTRNFTAQGEEGNVTLTGEDIPYSLASWITVSPENTTIDTKKRGVFTFTINAP